MSLKNLQAWYEKADADDVSEGMAAYSRYHDVMRMLGDHYGYPIERVVAVFSALSPNSDYVGNLRSTASVLRGINMGARADAIRTSGYNHCRDRAYTYATGERDFMDHAKGLKTRAFYRNLVDPTDWYPVTIDGHMVHAYDNSDGTMKDVQLPTRRYHVIADDTRRLADRLGMIPHQLQAIIWFCRKRSKGIIYDPQLDMFGDNTDKWKTVLTPDQIRPFPLYTEKPAGCERVTRNFEAADMGV